MAQNSTRSSDSIEPEPACEPVSESVKTSVFMEQTVMPDEPQVLSAVPAAANETFMFSTPPVIAGEVMPQAEPPAAADSTGTVARQVITSDESMPALSEQVILPDEAPMQPIWVTRSKEQPLDEILDDSFFEEPSDEKSFSRPESSDFPSRSDSLNNDKVDEDIFDEIYDASVQMYSNMSPKLKKMIIVTLVGTLLSIIPLIYAACSHQPEPTIDSYLQTPAVTSSSIN